MGSQATVTGKDVRDKLIADAPGVALNTLKGVPLVGSVFSALDASAGFSDQIAESDAVKNFQEQARTAISEEGKGNWFTDLIIKACDSIANLWNSFMSMINKAFKHEETPYASTLPPPPRTHTEHAAAPDVTPPGPTPPGVKPTQGQGR